jgi:signal peptidase II
LRSPKNKILILGSTSLILLIIDQWSKYVIRTTPELQNLSLIDGWLAFNFTKNPGMALGITWADTYIISLVAIVATLAITYYIVRTLKYANTAYLICMGLIIGGALGNITDRIFIAKIMGYGSWLDGHVVDFIHFNLEVGGYRVFPYIFNVADMGISIAIITLLIFGKWILPPNDPDKIRGKGEGKDGSGTEIDDAAKGKTGQSPVSDVTPGKETATEPAPSGREKTAETAEASPHPKTTAPAPASAPKKNQTASDLKKENHGENGPAGPRGTDVQDDTFATSDSTQHPESPGKKDMPEKSPQPGKKK